MYQIIVRHTSEVSWYQRTFIEVSVSNYPSLVNFLQNAIEKYIGISSEESNLSQFVFWFVSDFSAFCPSVTAVLTSHFRLVVLLLNNNQALRSQKGKTGINLLVTGSFSGLLMSKKLLISWVRVIHSLRWNHSSLFKRSFCISFICFEVSDDCSSALLQSGCLASFSMMVKC